MATRSVNNNVLHKKKTHMATKMGKRCVEVRPVNAWVQAEPVVNTNYQEATVRCIFLSDLFSKSQPRLASHNYALW